MLCRVAGRLMRHPAAPSREQAVRGEVERICVENGLDCKRDRFGNLLIRRCTAGRQRLLVLAAHLDHPGFDIVRSAYQEFGFQTVAVCVPLGNYHNCGDRRRIEEEYVSIADVTGMVHFLEAVARRMPQYRRLVARLPQRLKRLLRTARATLPKTAE